MLVSPKNCCFVMRNIISVFNFFARKRNPLIIICSHRPRRTSRGIDVLKTFDNYNLHPEHLCLSHEGVNSRITLGCWHPRKKCCFGSHNIISVFNFSPASAIPSPSHAVSSQRGRPEVLMY